MQYFISTLLIFISVPMILRFIVLKTQSTKDSSANAFKYTTFLPKLYFIGILFVTVIFIWAFTDLDSRSNLYLYIFTCLFYFPLAIVTICFIFRTLNFLLILDENYMVYRNLFGNVRKIGYERISRVEPRYDKSKNVIEYRIYIGNAKITVDYFMINFINFPRILKKRLKSVKSTVQFE